MITFDAKDIAEYLGLSEQSLRNLLSKRGLRLNQDSRRSVLNLIVERTQGHCTFEEKFKPKIARKKPEPASYHFRRRP